MTLICNALSSPCRSSASCSTASNAGSPFLHSAATVVPLRSPISSGCTALSTPWISPRQGNAIPKKSDSVPEGLSRVRSPLSPIPSIAERNLAYQPKNLIVTNTSLWKRRCKFYYPHLKTIEASQQFLKSYPPGSYLVIRHPLTSDNRAELVLCGVLQKQQYTQSIIEVKEHAFWLREPGEINVKYDSIEEIAAKQGLTNPIIPG